MKLFVFLFLSVHIAFGQPRKPFNNLNISEDSIYLSPNNKDLIGKLNEKIAWIDGYVINNENELELSALTSDSSDPVRVVNGEWPDNTIVSINVLRDQQDNVIYYAEYPFSQSGDWSIGYEYYAHADDGNIYGFRRTANFFNSMCEDGVLQEESVYYFDKDFILIEKDYSLTNTDGNSVMGTNCYFPYDYEYVIPENINELLK
jgi:hypothetical protein